MTGRMLVVRLPIKRNGIGVIAVGGQLVSHPHRGSGDLIGILGPDDIANQTHREDEPYQDSHPAARVSIAMFRESHYFAYPDLINP